MNEIDKLLEKTSSIIVNFNENDKEYIKYKLIEKILKTPKSFLEISINDAFNILKDIGVENVKETYFKIINQYL